MLFGGSLSSGFTGISVILCASEVFADSCVPPPISLDISNVTLSNSKTAWGIGMTVGTPGQPMAVMPQWYAASDAYEFSFSRNGRPETNNVAKGH